ncbi:hypothetical protein GOV10_01545 [Candidatus Woesearchaeota archaeon]|nr:hypothetical protein [Candidatus Woesearchaeota archaeon]
MLFSNKPQPYESRELLDSLLERYKLAQTFLKKPSEKISKKLEETRSRLQATKEYNGLEEYIYAARVENDKTALPIIKKTHKRLQEIKRAYDFIKKMYNLAFSEGNREKLATYYRLTQDRPLQEVFPHDQSHEGLGKQFHDLKTKYFDMKDKKKYPKQEDRWTIAEEAWKQTKELPFLIHEELNQYFLKEQGLN